MNNYNYRLALTSDVELLSVLFKTVYMSTYSFKGITYEFKDFMEKKFSPKQLIEDINNPNYSVWIATHNENPVGVVQVAYHTMCPLENEVFPEINKLYVLRHFFGTGVSQELMKLAEKEIRNKGWTKVWLWVLYSNERAINFYEKTGYTNIGEADFEMPVHCYKNFVMKKKL